jgi:hypothetical protein
MCLVTSRGSHSSRADLSQLVIGQIDTKLDSNSSVEQVEAALDKVCAKLGAFAKICDDLVTKYAPELVATLVAEHVNATRICAKIGVCPKSFAAPAPMPADFVPVAVADTLNFAGALGTQDCTQGPSYWVRCMFSFCAFDSPSVVTTRAFETDRCPSR